MRENNIKKSPAWFISRSESRVASGVRAFAIIRTRDARGREGTQRISKMMDGTPPMIGRIRVTVLWGRIMRDRRASERSSRISSSMQQQEKERRLIPMPYYQRGLCRRARASINYYTYIYPPRIQQRGAPSTSILWTLYICARERERDKIARAAR